MIYPAYIYCKRNFRNLHQKSEIFIIISYPPLHANFSKVVTPFYIAHPTPRRKRSRQLFRQLSPVIPQLFPQDLVENRRLFRRFIHNRSGKPAFSPENRRLRVFHKIYFRHTWQPTIFPLYWIEYLISKEDHMDSPTLFSQTPPGAALFLRRHSRRPQHARLQPLLHAGRRFRGTVHRRNGLRSDQSGHALCDHQFFAGRSHRRWRLSAHLHRSRTR